MRKVDWGGGAGEWAEDDERVLVSIHGAIYGPVEEKKKKKKNLHLFENFGKTKKKKPDRHCPKCLFFGVF
jgi:hypothetical protein